MKPCRIVQLTDLHLMSDVNGLLKNANPSQGLDRTLRHLSAAHEKPDLMIITGDLADDGASETYQRLKSQLIQFDVPVYVLLGNHDHAKNLEKSLLCPTINFCRHETIGSWHIVFVNTQVIGKEYGRVCQQEMLMLKESLARIAGQPCLLAMHHGPISHCQMSDCQLENAEEFLSLIGPYKNIKGLISGHTHQVIDVNKGQLRVMTTPSTFLKVIHPSSGSNQEHVFEQNVSGYRTVLLTSTGALKSEVTWLETS